jgi:N-acetylmuramoyl-L-alanine amidase
MKMKINSILLAILIIFSAAFFGGVCKALCETSKPAGLLKEADEGRKALYGSATERKYRYNWLRCIRRYEKLYTRYPKSDEAAWAIYHSAMLFTGLYTYSGRSEDLDESVRLYSRLVNEYRDHRLADDAQYLIGEIFYKYKNDASRAFEEFSKVEASFPSGDMRPRARKMLAKLDQVRKQKAESEKTGGTESTDQGSEKTALLLKQADEGRKALYGSATEKKYRHNWLRCIRRYERLYTRYPKSDEAAWAIYHSARLFTGLYTHSRKTEDLDKAVDLYRRLADEYSDHRLADDAQYRIGEIYYKYRKDAPRAYLEFLKVDLKFPSGDMRQRARQMLDELAVTISKKEQETDHRADIDPKSVLTAVSDIRHWSTPNYTRVVIDLEGQVKYEHHLLKPDPDQKKPRRLYLDLKDAKVTSQIDSAIPIKDGLLQRARAAQYSKNEVRVVLDMESIGGYEVFHLYDPFRIVIDVRRIDNEKDSELKTVAEKRALKGIRKAEVPDSKVSLARQLGLNVQRIVIDPGHGGKDPGCFLKGGIKEKDIVLSMAKILAKKIKEEVGCEVYLTRTTDVFLSLEQRTAIANMRKADLFISLHINAHKDKKIWGLETYFLNMATDERAVMVAARENATSEKNISDLQTILNDLMLNTKIHESSRLAHAVQGGIVSRVDAKYQMVKDLGVKQAPFYVLIGAQMPAILVETGFLTNRMERKRLLNKQYHERVAEGISTGINTYIKSIDQVYQGG